MSTEGRIASKTNPRGGLSCGGKWGEGSHNTDRSEGKAEGPENLTGERHRQARPSPGERHQPTARGQNQPLRKVRVRHSESRNSGSHPVCKVVEIAEGAAFCAWRPSEGRLEREDNKGEVQSLGEERRGSAPCYHRHPPKGKSRGAPSRCQPSRGNRDVRGEATCGGVLGVLGGKRGPGRALTQAANQVGAPEKEDQGPPRP